MSDDSYILRLGRVGVMPVKGSRRGEGTSSEEPWLKDSNYLVFRGKQISGNRKTA